MRRMRFGTVMALLVVCSGCEELTTAIDEAVVAATGGTITYTLDGATCSSSWSGAITFYVDGAEVGTATLSGGQSSPAYNVTAGSHFFSAAYSGGSWPSLSQTVVAGGSHTYLLTC